MSRIEAAAKGGMRHYGYTDKEIALAEMPVVHAEECEFIEQVGWQCLAEDGKSLHPESVELDIEFEMAQVHIAAADAHDQANGVHRVRLDDEAVERAAEAAALVEEEDGCFERVRAWEALEDWEQDAYPWEQPADDYESCEYWRKRVRAVIAALKEGQ